MKPTKSLIWRALAGLMIAGSAIVIPVTVASAAPGSCTTHRWGFDGNLQNTPTNKTNCGNVWVGNSTHSDRYMGWYRPNSSSPWTHGSAGWVSVGARGPYVTVITDILNNNTTHVENTYGFVGVTWAW